MSGQTRPKPLWRRALPFVGLVVVLGYLVATADLDGVRAAMARADLGIVAVVLVVGTLVTWLLDSACLVWLARRTLGPRAAGLALRDVAPVKAWSYVLNIINYNAATVGMGWVVSRRVGVGFLEATAGLAVLSYLDLIGLSLLVVLGFVSAPGLLDVVPALQGWLQAVVVAVFAGALVSLLALQSRWRGPALLERVRALPVVRPLTRLTPTQTLAGVVARAAFVGCYVAIAMGLMVAMGMAPELGKLLVFVPVLTVVGVVPLSVSGIGTTQVLMRTLYASFVVDGRDPGPVIDAMSTLQIFGFIAVRLLLALPFIPGVHRTLATARAEANAGRPESE